MSAAANLIVPSVPIFGSEGELSGACSSSPTKSTTSDLNPDAPDFQPCSPRHSLRAGAQDLKPRAPTTFGLTIDETTSQMLNLQIGPSASSASSASMENEKIQEGLHFSPRSNAFVLTCDTRFMPDLTQSKDIATALVTTHGSPFNVHLNILTGPRLPLIQRAVEWCTETLGAFNAKLRKIQITIIRCGEKIGSKWTLMDLDLEKFYPLTNFVAEILQIFPVHAHIIWGACASYNLKLREYYLAKAVSAGSIVLESQNDRAVQDFSSAIGSEILQKIAHQFAHLKGRKARIPRLPNAPNFHPGTMSNTSEGNGFGAIVPATHSFSSSANQNPFSGGFSYGYAGTTSGSETFNPNAAPFRFRGSAYWDPSQQLAVDSRDEPFHEQLLEVAGSRNYDRVPSAFDSSAEYGQPADMHVHHEARAQGFPTLQTTPSFNQQNHHQQARYPLDMPLREQGYNQLNENLFTQPRYFPDGAALPSVPTTNEGYYKRNGSRNTKRKFATHSSGDLRNIIVVPGWGEHGTGTITWDQDGNFSNDVNYDASDGDAMYSNENMYSSGVSNKQANGTKNLYSANSDAYHTYRRPNAMFSNEGGMHNRRRNGNFNNNNDDGGHDGNVSGNDRKKKRKKTEQKPIEKTRGNSSRHRDFFKSTVTETNLKDVPDVIASASYLETKAKIHRSNSSKDAGTHSLSTGAEAVIPLLQNLQLSGDSFGPIVSEAHHRLHGPGTSPKVTQAGNKNVSLPQGYISYAAAAAAGTSDNPSRALQHNPSTGTRHEWE